MDKLVITGGRRLAGDIDVSGAKNAALPLLAATLLAPGVHQLGNVPKLRDIETFKKLLQNHGAKIETAPDSASIDTREITSVEAPYELVKTMRASVLVLGPLVARMGRARVSLPGGCAIGSRPIDLHLKGLEAMGAEIKLEHGYVQATARRLQGTEIQLDFPTVTGTENLMMAAALAQGRTVIHNAAKEPEIADLAAALTGMGATVTGAGTDSITIEGADELLPMKHRVMPDRIEMGTFLCAVGIAGGDVRVKGGDLGHLESLAIKLRASGMQLTPAKDHVRAVSEKGALRAVDAKTLPYPGFATDMQAQFMATMCTAQGPSVISETVFENRFQHVPELHRMGADIRIEGSSAIVHGGNPLSGAHVMATDLRASASLVIAGLAAEGETHVHRVYHLDRGYDRIEEKLGRLGADVKRVKDDLL
jgi:UDP-N-acetylglucosamine 1-carboxyvinyltransferase